MKKNSVILVVLIATAALLVYLFVSGGVNTLSSHSNPADISKSNSTGQGITVQAYHCPDSVLAQYNSTGLIPLSVEQTECTLLTIPQNFGVGAGASIVTNLGNPTVCSTTAQCQSKFSSTGVECYQGQCVLASVSSIQVGVSVTNPSTSQVTFNNVYPSSVSPTIWNTSMSNKTAVTLIPGQTGSWSGSGILTSGLQGTNQTFAVVVSATNSYTGAVTTVSDQVQLRINADPTGALTISIASPV